MWIQNEKGLASSQEDVSSVVETKTNMGFLFWKEGKMAIEINKNYRYMETARVVYILEDMQKRFTKKKLESSIYQQTNSC